MSNSLTFCKSIAADESRSTFSDRDWGCAKELTDTESLFDKYLHGARQLCCKGDVNGEKISLNVSLTFDDNSDFEYFTSESFIHDGTLLFIVNSIERCIQKVCSVQTYDKRIGKPEDGDCIKYTIGNFVILNENKIGLSKLPWMNTKTTVTLPLKMTNE